MSVHGVHDQVLTRTERHHPADPQTHLLRTLLQGRPMAIAAIHRRVLLYCPGSIICSCVPRTKVDGKSCWPASRLATEPCLTWSSLLMTTVQVHPYSCVSLGIRSPCCRVRLHGCKWSSALPVDSSWHRAMPVPLPESKPGANSSSGKP